MVNEFITPCLGLNFDDTGNRENQYEKAMKNGGVIFDFNGTLFWDSEYVEISWDKYLASHHIYLSSLQKKEQIHGKTPKDIFNFFLRRDLSDSEVKQYTEDKELFIEMNV